MVIRGGRPQLSAGGEAWAAATGVLLMNEERLNAGQPVQTGVHRHDRDPPDSLPGTETGAVTSTAFLPGVTAGVVGLAVFLVLHAVWIVPIWFVAPIGVVIAVLGGAAVNWAYLHGKPRLPDGNIRRWVAVAGGAVLILLPSLLVAWAGEPYFTIVDGGGVPTADGSVLAVRFIIEFLVVAVFTGAVIGWTVTRTRRGTVAVAVAALALALGPGHNLPFFHLATAPVETRTAIMLTLVPIAIASAIFVVVDVLRLRGETQP